jgi:hypothetical protein
VPHSIPLPPCFFCSRVLCVIKCNVKQIAPRLVAILSVTGIRVIVEGASVSCSYRVIRQQV